MTVSELRKALADAPDDMPVVTYGDSGYINKEPSAAIQHFAPKAEGQVEEWVWEHSRHPAGTVGVPYFLVA